MVWKSTASFYDEVARVPLILRYPSQIQPQESHIAVGLTDVMPTLLDLAGHPIPNHIEGNSLRTYLSGTAHSLEAPRYAFSERIPPSQDRTRDLSSDTQGSFMIRGSGWKYIVSPDEQEFLYDLETNPGETLNLADLPSARSQKTELRERLRTWLVSTNYRGKHGL